MAQANWNASAISWALSGSPLDPGHLQPTGTGSCQIGLTAAVNTPGAWNV